MIPIFLRFSIIGGRGAGGVGTSSGVEGGGEGEQQEQQEPGGVNLSEEFSR